MDLDRKQRSRRIARFRAAAAKELAEAKTGALWGGAAALVPGAFVAWSTGVSLAVVLPIAVVLGAIAGYVCGPRVALLLVGAP